MPRKPKLSFETLWSVAEFLFVLILMFLPVLVFLELMKMIRDLTPFVK